MARAIRYALSVFAALCILGAARPAAAQAICSGSLSLNFGSIDLTEVNGFPTSGTLTINCNGAGGQQIAVCSSAGADGPFNMGGMGFRLFQDSAGATPFAVATSVTINGATGSGSSGITVWGRISAGQQSFPASSTPYVATGQAINFTYAVGSNCVGGAGATVLVQAQALYPPTCKVSALPMNFSAVGLLTTSADASTTITAQCSQSTPYNVLLDGGRAASTDPTQRKLTLAGNQVTYGLYRDAARTQPWGSTVGSNTAAGTGSGFNQSLTVFGRIPPQPTPPPGSYQDLITVTMSY
jgi:spore coat protein U-like protein